MSANVGKLDRLARLVLGVVLLVAPFVTQAALFQSGTMTTVSVVVGLILVGTSAMKFCPLYRLLGVNTCRI